MSCVPNKCSVAIELFAKCCEQINDFARDLRHEGIYQEVRTGADIRNYESGWRLEKYIEAELDANQGLWLAWWLELGLKDDKWIVSANVSVSHTDLFFELPDHLAVDEEQLKISLQKAVSDLKAAVTPDSKFGMEIEKFLKEKK